MTSLTPTRPAGHVPDQISATRRPGHPWLLFAAHFVEMTSVMSIGMVAAVTVFMYGINLTVERIEWDEVLQKYPAQALLVVAIGMSLPMIPWMRARGHTWRSAYEMAAVMAVPAIPFICLALFGAVQGAQCGLYCLTGLVAMLGLMLYRRPEYQSRHAHHASR